MYSHTHTQVSAARLTGTWASCFGKPRTGFSRRNGVAFPDSLILACAHAPLCVCLAMPQHSTDALAILQCDSQKAVCGCGCGCGLCVGARVLNECMYVCPFLSSLALTLSPSLTLSHSLSLSLAACACVRVSRAVQALFNLPWNGKVCCVCVRMRVRV
jgi:hypothetical protein